MRCGICTVKSKGMTYLYGGGWVQTQSKHPDVIRNNFFGLMKLGNWIAGDACSGSPKERFNIQGMQVMRMLAQDVGLSETEIKFIPGNLASSGCLVLKSKDLYVTFIPVHGVTYVNPELGEEYTCWLRWDELIESYQKSCLTIRRYIREMEWNKKAKEAVSTLTGAKNSTG